MGLDALVLWQKAIAFTTYICQQVIPAFPEQEKWALAAQIRRSAQSIPANIAEGHGRYYYQEGIRYCYIARGSLEETTSHLILAHNLGYIDPKSYQHLRDNIQELERLINGYISYLKQSKRGASEPGVNLTLREEPDPYLPDSTYDRPTPPTASPDDLLPN